ncbi:hypothetical protein F5B22DRAFT_585713 [Xylaria bambusicola]|uniref:uncharacterized protein n=1 Tax=Xylaria bambusicola TaxID=326684 RepID=UPI00200893A0|nr:uncharacterized protein F5B22DRAFT_585713 [Xylaria bambusicola]KAI0526429.1 hypothetical protein F5B22DRAFT_585713 [Xylaria bambusicola]
MHIYVCEESIKYLPGYLLYLPTSKVKFVSDHCIWRRSTLRDKLISNPVSPLFVRPRACNMLIIYSIDSAITSFFESNKTVTRQQCDDFALSRVGGQVVPVPIQGSYSYTIMAGRNESRIFQFRTHNSVIDISIIDLAKTIHPQLIADCKYHGTIGQSQPLHIYEMNKLPGTNYITARPASVEQSPAAVARQQNTAAHLAKFFAQSWNHRQQLHQDDRAALLADFRDKFELLSQSLPSRFAPNLDRVSKELPRLFKDTLPFVFCHDDLREMNILIQPETGSITGVVDWAEARILPFGLTLWALENILGYMNSKGWHYFNNRHELEKIFWDTFRKEAENLSDDDLPLIHIARMTGLFYHYGLLRDGKVCQGVVHELHSFAYLDAFCTIDDWMPFM